ncbi:MAG: cation-translocating P-type ATPase [Candidatus Pacebacteria bacterium]|nr:cation-translocating P-type ATPase [Candidatus Paceibacterota bacterium]MBP9842839.1 cation-translocating P-type ATPase [Candidatus Paceibacterota bacterium]
MEHEQKSSCGHCHSDDHAPTVSPKENVRQITLNEVALRFFTPLSGLLMFIGFTWSFTENMEAWGNFFYILSIIFGSVFVVRSAFNGLIRKRFLNISFLVVIAALGAVYIGEYGEAAAVVFLFSLAEFFESFGIERSRRAVEALLKRAPKVARLQSGEMVPVEEVAIGVVVVVKPGEQIPLDGTITVGGGTVDESAITGESAPVDKVIGNSVFAGTMNIQGYLEVTVDKTSGDSMFARIITLIKKAQVSRAVTDTFIEKFARYYTPLIVVISLLVAVVPTLLLGLPFEDWLYRAITLLVIACPCALVISTPVAIASAIGGASRHGILIKGGAYLEKLASVRAIAFDKTRTLTYGRHSVTEVFAFGSHSKEEVIADAAGIELFSSHPLAEAVLDYAKAQNITPHTMDSFENVAGKGGHAHCLVCSARHYIGNHKLMADSGVVSDGFIDTIERLEKEGQTVVLIASDKELIGAIAIADEIRTEAKMVIAELNKLGVSSVMLTGDNQYSARYVADRVGITEAKAALSPEDKLNNVVMLQKQYRSVAMVGDGINDAPSLATADVGIAIGAGGTDVAIETADVALLSGNLSTIPQAIRLARATMQTIRFNVTLALIAKLVFLVLVITGQANLVMAIAADSGVAILVILLSLRLFTR